MFTITKNVSSKYILNEIKREAKEAFGERLRDLNEINDGEKLRIYLKSSNDGDENLFKTLLKNHDPVKIKKDKVNKLKKLKQDKALVLTKLGITEAEFELLNKS